MPRPVHFELHSADPSKSQKFFKGVFGWKVSKWDGPMEYWLLQTGDGDGIDGGMMASRDGQPRTVNTIHVEDVSDCCETIKANGGQVVVEKMPIQGVGYVAYATDPTGVLFGVMEADESAA